MASESKISKRKPNWADDELQVLASSIRENRDILFAKFSSGVTAEKKKEVWMEITKQ
jgi:hypothetical protein